MTHSTWAQVRRGLVLRKLRDEEEHTYLSTSCLHGHHAYCQTDVGIAGLKTPAKCKFCPATCICECHQAAAE